MKAFGRRRVRLAELEIVIVGELIARTYIATALYEDAFVFIDDLAIGRARMIDPTRRVALLGGINNDLLVNLEKHGVRRILMRFGIAFVGLVLRNPFAFVLDNSRMFGNVSEGKDAPAMNG